MEKYVIISVKTVTIKQKKILMELEKIKTINDCMIYLLVYLSPNLNILRTFALNISLKENPLMHIILYIK